MIDELIKPLKILEVEKLRIHEQTIPENTAHLREMMLNTGRLVDPIIVDKKHLIVLDGNHRRHVLELLGCPNAVCQVVDYDREDIIVGGWFPHSPKKPSEIFGEKPESVDFEHGMRELRSMKAYLMAVREVDGKRECGIYSSDKHDLRGLIEKQKDLFSTSRVKLHFAPDDMADIYLKNGETVFFRKNYTKDEIVHEALAGRPFPPKSTRHLIPGRMIRLNVPLGWLSEDEEAAHKLIVENLKKRAVHGSVRRYTEPVTVIY